MIRVEAIQTGLVETVPSITEARLVPVAIRSNTVATTNVRAAMTSATAAAPRLSQVPALETLVESFATHLMSEYTEARLTILAAPRHHLA